MVHASLQSLRLLALSFVGCFPFMPIVGRSHPNPKPWCHVFWCLCQAYEVVMSACKLAVEGVNGPVLVDLPCIHRGLLHVLGCVLVLLQAYEVVVSACKLAVEGVNGPVLVDLPEDVQALMVSLPHRHPHIATGMQQQPACGTASAAAAANGPSAAAAAAGGGSAAGTTSGGGAAFVTSPLGSHFGGWLAPEPAGFRSHTPNPISRAVMQEVLKSIRGAKRPLLLLGGGCVGCDEALLNELVEVLGVPVVYTFMGKVSSGLNMDARSMHCLVPHCDFHCPAQRTIDCKVG